MLQSTRVRASIPVSSQHVILPLFTGDEIPAYRTQYNRGSLGPHLLLRLRVECVTR